jgi:hypothetical protein
MSGILPIVAIGGSFCSRLPKTAPDGWNFFSKPNGAFWQDRYHATAIETGEHLWRCLVYVCLNMVRAGVVKTSVRMEVVRLSRNPAS